MNKHIDWTNNHVCGSCAHLKTNLLISLRDDYGFLCPSSPSTPVKTVTGATTVPYSLEALKYFPLEHITRHIKTLFCCLVTRFFSASLL